MSRIETIEHINATLAKLPDERVRMLADLADEWSQPVDIEDFGTLAAIAEGVAQAKRGEFATDAQVAETFARFRR